MIRIAEEGVTEGVLIADDPADSVIQAEREVLVPRNKGPLLAPLGIAVEVEILVGMIVVVNDRRGGDVVDGSGDVDVVEDVIDAIGVIGMHAVDEGLQVAVVLGLAGPFADPIRGGGHRVFPAIGSNLVEGPFFVQAGACQQVLVGLLDEDPDIEIGVVDPDEPGLPDRRGDSRRGVKIPRQHLPHVGRLGTTLVEIDLVDPGFVGIEQEGISPVELELPPLGRVPTATTDKDVVVEFSQEIDRPPRP